MSEIAAAYKVTVQTVSRWIIETTEDADWFILALTQYGEAMRAFHKYTVAEKYIRIMKVRAYLSQRSSESFEETKKLIEIKTKLVKNNIDPLNHWDFEHWNFIETWRP